jgi:hypothetical protein
MSWLKSCWYESKSAVGSSIVEVVLDVDDGTDRKLKVVAVLVVSFLT